MPRFLVLIFIISIALNVMFFGELVASSQGIFGSYPLLASRIFSQNPNDVIINFNDLRSQLRPMVDAQKDMHMGVYFEYLPSGISIGVHENQNFISASLIKVPFIMGISQLIEQGKLKTDQIITLQKEDLDPGFGTLWKKGVGTTLTVDQAIRLTLTESDNTAALALDHFSPTDPIRDVYHALDIPVDWVGNEPVITAKNYSSVLRCLYLSCFLSYDASEHILDLLTQTIFTNGLPAGVPAGVRVAHKIGVYDSPNAGKGVRLDCGIVYVPKRRYILCVLGEADKGREDQIADVTQQISKKVYDFVSGANPHP